MVAYVSLRYLHLVFHRYQYRYRYRYWYGSISIGMNLSLVSVWHRYLYDEVQSYYGDNTRHITCKCAWYRYRYWYRYGGISGTLVRAELALI